MSLYAFMICSIGTGFADGTLVGYLRNFHPDLAEPWGVGITIAQFSSIIMNLYTTNYNLDAYVAYLYFAMTLICSVPTMMAFTKAESIRQPDSDAKEPDLLSKTGLSASINLIKKLRVDLIGMLFLQFWNDFFMNCVIVIDVSKRELFAQKKLAS